MNLRLQSVTNNATTPQPINADVFGGIDVSKVPLYVPTGSIAQYKAAPVWKDFFGIKSIGIEEIAAADELTIYPNPAKDEIFIRSEQPVEKVEISDIAGRVVASAGSATVAINVSTLPAGIYFVRVFVGNQIVTKKIIKE